MVKGKGKRGEKGGVVGEGEGGGGGGGDAIWERGRDRKQFQGQKESW